MSNSSSESSSVRIACLTLRVTLAVIFIWHGIDKLRSDNFASWGAAWAERADARNTSPPPRALQKLRQMRDESPRHYVLKDDKGSGELTDEKAREIAASRHVQAELWLQQAYTSTKPDANATLQFAAVQYAVTWGEILGGLALLVGLLTRIAALGLLIVQAGAIYFVTLPLGLVGDRSAGYEYNLALMAMCLALVLLGPGGLSVDHFLHWGRATPRPQQPQQQQQAQAQAS